MTFRTLAHAAVAAETFGHCSDAFNTTVLPYASGAATARTPRITGAFHGAIPTTTPTGWRTAFARLPGMCEGISCSSAVASACLACTRASRRRAAR